MLFRLEDGTVVALDDGLVNLCEFFVNIRDMVNPFTALEETLRKGPYKKIRAEFIALLKQSLVALQNGCEALNDDCVHQLSNPESALSQHLKFSAGDNEQLRNCLEFVHVNIDELLAPVIHRLRFLKDKTFLMVLEYLKIQSPLRADNMFDTLPARYQGRDPDTDLRTLLEPSLSPYVDFVEKLDDEMFMDVSKAALHLGIKSLVTLIGCRMAQFLNTQSTQNILTRFGVPDDKFFDATKRKLDQILTQKAWLSAAPFVAPAQQKPADQSV